MRQVAILPAGCQIQNKDILFANEEKLYYASTLAIYVYHSKTCVLEKVLSISDRTLSCICVSPFDHNIIVAAAIDGCISTWKIDEEIVKARAYTQMQSRTNIVAWNPHLAHEIVFISSQPYTRVLSWDTSKTGTVLNEMFAIRNKSFVISCAKWNPHTAGLLAAGCNNSWVFLFNTLGRSQKTLQIKDRNSPVSDLQWDRLSSIYLLVAYQYFISLWDTESCTEIHTFEKQNVSITSIAWMDWTAGSFVSTNSKTGTLKMWNASQRQPLSTVRASSTGILSIVFSPGAKRALFSCTDGSIGVFHTQRQQLEFSTAPGHTDTIFDCVFAPSNSDVFATASYDGTVKLWNLSTLSLAKTLYASDGILYGCAFSARGKMLAACSATGVSVVWDFETCRELARFVHHTKPVYCIAWNPCLENVVCTTSGDGTVVVFEVDIDTLYDPHSASVPTGSRKKGAITTESTAESVIRMRFTHPGPVFGCSWSPHSQHVLATGCQDGKVSWC